MRKFALIVLTAATFGIPAVASAADMGVYRKAPAPVPYLWTGSYIGGYIGGATGADNLVTSVPVNAAGAALFAGPAASYNYGSGFIGGYTGGYNWQFNPNWVLGYESETGYINLRARGAFTGAPLNTAITNVDNGYNAWTARLGYTWGQQMIYAKGGVALARFETGVVNPTPGAHVDTLGHKYRVGYAAGGGWEYMFAPKWSIKAEYLYLGFDSSLRTTGNANPGAQQFTTTSLGGIHTGKVGINYKWDWFSLLR